VTANVSQKWHSSCGLKADWKQTKKVLSPLRTAQPESSRAKSVTQDRVHQNWRWLNSSCDGQAMKQSENFCITTECLILLQLVSKCYKIHLCPLCQLGCYIKELYYL